MNSGSQIRSTTTFMLNHSNKQLCVKSSIKSVSLGGDTEKSSLIAEINETPGHNCLIHFAKHG